MDPQAPADTECSPGAGSKGDNWAVSQTAARFGFARPPGSQGCRRDAGRARQLKRQRSSLSPSPSADIGGQRSERIEQCTESGYLSRKASKKKPQKTEIEIKGDQ